MGYLAGPYLREKYLRGAQTAEMHVGVQVSIPRVSDTGKKARTQALLVIDALKRIHAQTTFKFENVLNTVGMQVFRTWEKVTHNQVTMVLYNDTQLRILREFVSRGLPSLGGTNWTVSPAAAVGDFSPNNLNTDVIEQCYRSQDGQQAYVALTCDTGLPQGAFVDTVAILGHNFTRSAIVTLQGSNNAGFSPIGVSLSLSPELQNMFYIAPSLPTKGWRYWRFIIEDGTNPANFLQVGTILFGAAEIFSRDESFTNPVTQSYKHFKDAIETEGFTTVSNDRALRKTLKLSFEKLLFNQNNFQKLLDTVLLARTSLKMLYIPTPKFPSRFAIFGKLSQMPEMQHTNLDADTEYVDISLDIDEST